MREYMVKPIILASVQLILSHMLGIIVTFHIYYYCIYIQSMIYSRILTPPVIMEKDNTALFSRGVQSTPLSLASTRHKFSRSQIHPHLQEKFCSFKDTNTTVSQPGRFSSSTILVPQVDPTPIYNSLRLPLPNQLVSKVPHQN